MIGRVVGLLLTQLQTLMGVIIVVYSELGREDVMVLRDVHLDLV